MFALHFAWILLGILLGFLLKQNIIYPKGYKMQYFETNKKTRNKRKEITKEESDIKKKINKEKKTKKRKNIYAEFQKRTSFFHYNAKTFSKTNIIIAC